MKRGAWLRGLGRLVALGCAGAMLLFAAGAAAQPSRLVWAWERAEALDTLPRDVGVAAVLGFIRLRGGAVAAMRGRRFPLVVAPGRAAPVSVVHIEIDQTEPLDWTPRLREEVTAAALLFTRGAPHVQVDMEVRRSQRAALLDVLRGVRAGLAPGATLSMTALASWCDTEHWLDGAPVDEVVPMLFRLGPTGPQLRARLAAGGDFNEPRCRTAVGISLDAPVVVPPNRRVYVFNPRPWDAATVATLPPG